MGVQEPCKDNIAVYDIIGKYVMERVIGVCESGVYEICAINKYGSDRRRLIIIIVVNIYKLSTSQI